MAAQASATSTAMPGLLKLPNEILLSIAADLRILELRYLGRTCRQLRPFVQDYLDRHRYKSGLFALPEQLVYKVVGHLPNQKDRSQFARVSQKLYPPVTQHIASYDIEKERSRLLHYAVDRNLRGMVSQTVQLGGDIETTKALDWPYKRSTPLVQAVSRGHIELVRVLLAAGAQQVVDGVRRPLLRALNYGHEDIALCLCQDLTSTDYAASKNYTMLHLACDAKMVQLVRFLLERPPRNGEVSSTTSEVQNQSEALCRILTKTASWGTPREMRPCEDIVQIVLMLLQHHADPDMEVAVQSTFTTAREATARHSDPNVKKLLPRAPAVSAGNAGTLLEQLDPSLNSEEEQQEEEWLSDEPSECSTVSDDPLDNKHVDETTWSETEEQEEQEDATRPNSHDRSALDAATMTPTECNRLIGSLQAPPLSVYPRLGDTTTSERSYAEEGWGQTPAEIVVAYSAMATSRSTSKQSVKQKVQEPAVATTTLRGARKINRARKSEEEISEGMFEYKDVRAAERRYSLELSRCERFESMWYLLPKSVGLLV